jgi:glycyl-radical enzyme activating protein
MNRGLVFDIQRFSLHDGHGIRTLVFMKGCPLRCPWCSNPESQSRKPEVMFFEERCISCGACIEACPNGEALRAHWPLGDGSCDDCTPCVAACWPRARVMVGREMSRDDVLEIIRRDRVFYEESHGGITVGGGEPTMQPDFVAGLLESCRAEGIHTAIETCGYAPWETMKKVLDHVDELLMDIKHMDSAIHKEWTGVANERILANAQEAANLVQEMVVRVPLIPGFNDDNDNLNELGAFVKQKLTGVTRVDVLPYHSTGESKSTRLRREFKLGTLEPQGRDRLGEIKALLSSYGLDARVG